MKVDVSQENNMTNYSGGIGNGMIVEASVSHVSKSYAGVVSGTSTTVMSDQPSNLDDVVVRILGLPYRYYSKALFRHIVGVIGWVVKIDYNIHVEGPGRFARLVVMVNLKQPFVLGVWIDETLFHLEYEGLQRVCFNCGLYGHIMEDYGKVQGSEARPVPLDWVINDNATLRQEHVSIYAMYGPYMIAENKRRKPRKDLAIARGGTPITSIVGGSQFHILQDEASIKDLVNSLEFVGGSKVVSGDQTAIQPA
ncbi:hypothetical protein GQ457_13G018020 [Hibiscus cannabinus]